MDIKPTNPENHRPLNKFACSELLLEHPATEVSDSIAAISGTRPVGLATGLAVSDLSSMPHSHETVTLSSQPAIWFPTVRTNSGADVFTERLAAALNRCGIRAEITWLPQRAEYAPWAVAVPKPPAWANVVHINSWLHTRFIPNGLPLVVTVHHCVHDFALEPYKSLPQALYHRWWVKNLETLTIHKANVVTAVSHNTARQTKAVFGRDDVITIYNWIDTEQFCPKVRQETHHPFRLLFVGNLTWRKGADLLPQIMERLGNDFELRYTGSADAFGPASSLPPNMISLGRIPDIDTLVKIYQSQDALLFPTRLEGFGLVALEAQSCGCPVITTHCSSLPEVVEQGKTGFLCPADDIDAFVAAVRRLRDDPIAWRKMCTDARKRAVGEFGERTAIEQYLAIYNRLLTPQ